MNIKKTTKAELAANLLAEKSINETLRSENEKLKQSRTDLAQANVHLLSALNAEKKKMPVNGRYMIALVTGVALSILGYFTPAEPVKLMSFSVNGNLFSFGGVIIIAATLLEPIVTKAITRNSKR